MELAEPFDFKAVPAKDRAGVKDEMVKLVSRLHDEYGIVHGDIKPPNFLRCQDGKLRFCDFDSARRINETTDDEWEGFFSNRYLAPNRNCPRRPRLPTTEDDWYGLAISLWELYTGKDALEDEDMEALWKERKTVDVNARGGRRRSGFYS